MKKVKLIIFDLDGTLVNAYSAIIRSFNFTMQVLHYPRQSHLTICRAVGWGDENLLKPFVDSEDLKKALLVYRRHHKKALIEDSGLFPGVEKVLRYLKGQDYKLAVASNRPTKFSWMLIRQLKIKNYFDYILCADKLRHLKPHPEILQKIMLRFRVKNFQALYVGDMAIDAQAARRAGIKSIIVTTGSSTKKEIKKEKPYRIIRRIKELLQIL